jgi:FlaA1/EpsC-like NDP-sugar epimerase
MNVGLWIAFVLVHGLLDPHDVASLLRLSAILTAIGALILVWRRQYSFQALYIDVNDFLNIGAINLCLGVILALTDLSLNMALSEAEHWLVPLLYSFLSGASMSAARLIYRAVAVKTGLARQENKPDRRRRALLVGAGDAGEIVAREIARSARSEYQVVAFVDDDPDKLRTSIHGKPVVGRIDEIPDVVEKYNIDQVLILLPSAGSETIRRVANLSRDTGTRIRILPSIASLLNSPRHLTSQLREIDIEDILYRDPVQIDIQEVAQYVMGEHVLITGGGGSIGSELARQIARLSPASLILLGRGENSIYEIEQELLQTHGFAPKCVIADVKDPISMNRVFETYRPSVVFHTAAHKHVPLMQSNTYEAILNNVGGTMLTAELAVKYGVKKFILISTDKAVKPTSIMGATKRVCEQIASSLGQCKETEFAVVRFGNVLGSRGSLIPVIKAQIRRGGPVKVTHRDMKRFFMTIPEAVQLIVQAGAIGKKGEIFILDMGEPVRIYDLVVDLIRLHGLEPGEDIAIQFTGIRPGEKVDEELVYERESLRPTKNTKINEVVNLDKIDYCWLKKDLETLYAMCRDGRLEQATQFLMELAWGKSSIPAQSNALEKKSDFFTGGQ